MAYQLGGLSGFHFQEKLRYVSHKVLNKQKRVPTLLYYLSCNAKANIKKTRARTTNLICVDVHWLTEWCGVLTLEDEVQEVRTLCFPRSGSQRGALLRPPLFGHSWRGNLRHRHGSMTRLRPANAAVKHHFYETTPNTRGW